MGLASILGSCDEGKIYPSETDSGNEGFSVVMTGNVVGSSDYGSGYSLALAVFEEGSDFAEISKRVDGEEENSKDVELSNVNIKEGTAELCVINSLRKRVITFASLPVSGVKSGETITFNVGDVDVSQYGTIADRIFATTCIQCHGATGHSAAGLDLNREQAYAMLVDVASVVEPGKMRVAPANRRGHSTAVYGVADPDESYVLQVKPGSSVSISVADDGMLLGINTDAEPPYRPTAYKPALPKENTKPIDEYLKFVDEDFLACQSTYKQAEMLAAALMEIREARISLTRGTAETMPTDGRQLELMLASLQDQEDAIKRAFTGETIIDSYTRSYLVMPEEEGEQIVFRFSEFDGFVEADDLSGEPVNMDLRIVSEPETPLDVKGEPKKLPKDAVVYNIPATARVTLTHDGRKMAQKDYGFGQFGTTFGLQPTLFSDKKEPYRATFIPADGALLRLEPLQ